MPKRRAAAVYCIGITPLEQLPNPYHGNSLVLQEKFDSELD